MKKLTKVYAAVALSLSSYVCAQNPDPKELPSNKGTFAQSQEQPGSQTLAALRKRAEAGDAEAQYQLFLRYEKENGAVEARAEAVGWLRKAAEAGLPIAQVSLGLLYREGKREVAMNLEEAVQWFRKAAEQGNALGESELGFMYEKGDGVAKDEAEAVRWYTRAADRGLPIAKFDLAFMYEKGHGVPVDVDKAIALYEQSSFSIPTARRNLAILYHDGKLQPKDLAEAYKWAVLDVSAEERRIRQETGVGEDVDSTPRLGYALVLLKDFSKDMSKKDRENGLRMAQDWIQNNTAHLGDEPQTFPETLKRIKKIK